VTNPDEMVREFHETHGAAIAIDPRNWGEDRIRLLESEVQELVEAIRSGDPVAILHECADVVYCCYGNAVAAGYLLGPVLVEVHRANMSKDGCTGGPHGKAIKGTRYIPADIPAEMHRLPERDT